MDGDLEFLIEMRDRLNRGRNGNVSELEAVDIMLRDWINELSEKSKNTGVAL